MPLAIAQNRRQWDKLAPAPAEPDALLVRFEESAHRQQARYLKAQRERLETAIRECSAHPTDFWNHTMLRGLKKSFGSTDEAVTAILYEIRSEWNRKSYDRDRARIAMLKHEALVLARYFRRFSRAVWAQQRAA